MAKMTKFESLGETAARLWIDAEQASTSARKKALVDMAVTCISSGDGFQLALKAYEAAFKEAGYSDASCRVRKSEAKAVYEAVTATAVSRENEKQLAAFEGGYHDLIKLARWMKPAKEKPESEGKEERKAKKLSSKQYDRLEGLTEKASPEQLLEISQQAVIDISKKAPANLAGYQTLLLIQSAAVQLGKADDIFTQAAADILSVVDPVIARVKAAQNEAQKAAQSLVTAPVKEGTETEIEIKEVEAKQQRKKTRKEKLAA